MSERYTLISTDSHAGLPAEGYRDYIDSRYHAAFDAAQAEAEAMRQKYQSQLAEVRAEAAKVRDDARLEAEQIRAEAREEAQAEAARIVAQGQAQLQAQRQQVVAELRSEYGRNSIELASRIVGESLEDEARRRGTVERFLSELDAAGSRN